MDFSLQIRAAEKTYYIEFQNGLLELIKRKNKTGKIYFDERNLLKQDVPHQQDDPFIDDDPPESRTFKRLKTETFRSSETLPQVITEPPQEAVPPLPPPKIYTPMQSLEAFKQKMALYDTSALDANVDGVDFGVQLYYVA